MLPVTLAAASLVGALVLTQRNDGDGSANAAPVGRPGEIFAEPAGDIGPAPFTPPVVTSAPVSVPTNVPAPGTTDTSTPTTSDTSTDSTPGSTPAVVLQQIDGAAPGLYGGSQDNATCDVEQLISFLENDADKAAAWSEAQGIESSEIRTFVEGLTPVLIRADIRVTNFGYDDGRPVPRQAVLQAGTAVLVDDRGVPRARCKCGNPLAEPKAVTGTPTYTGTPWTGLDPSTTQVISPAPEPMDSLVLTDPVTGTQFERPIGTDGEADRPVTTSTELAGTTTTSSVSTSTTTVDETSTTTPSTSTSTSTPVSASNVPGADTSIDVTADGVVAASTEYPGGGFPVSNVFDGDRTTSWFSAGDADRTCVPIAPGASCSDLLWVHGEPADVLIERVDVLNNSQHPDYPTGFGFGSVTIEITNLSGVVVSRETYLLPGEDPDVVVTPNVRGHSVHLVFEGHDSPDCGGISEFRVIGRP
jgi:hypothetical protein